MLEDRDERPETHTADPVEGPDRRDCGEEPTGEHEVESADPAPLASSSRRPSYARARIEGVEAGVAAGLVPAGGSDEGEAGSPASETARPYVPDPEDADLFLDYDAAGHEGGAATPMLPVLPDWRDPPTREVPRVLLEHPLADPAPSYPGPVWREVETDWDDDDLTFAEIVDEGAPVADHGLGIDEPDPFAFDFLIEPTATLARPAESAPEEEDGGWDGSAATAHDRELAAAEATSTPAGEDEETAATPRPPRRSGRGLHRARVSFAERVRHNKATAPVASVSARGAALAEVVPSRAASKRNPIIATVTGLAVGVAVLLIFWAGPPAVLALAAVVLVGAAAECYQVLRRARYQPAVLVGLLGVAAAAIGAYLHGPVAELIVGATVVIATLCWYLFGVTRRSPVANFAATVMGWAWIGLMGGFAALLIAPRAFPHRHGLAYLLGAIIATVAYDVGGYAFGSWIGHRRLAPAVSPNKTVEGLLGGCFTAIAISVAIVGRMHPWTWPHALELGVVVAVFAPLGDLAESMIKRDIGVKDMGTLLPAHGGLLDRIDGLLFVLPATYCLVRLFHG